MVFTYTLGVTTWSGSMAPGSTSFSTSAIVCSDAVANTGLKFLAERVRAGGAGIGGFYTPTGVGTVVAEGKELRVLNGREYVLEMPIRGDFAFVKAYQGDREGNLLYRRSARNFNPVVATASEHTVAEVEKLVEPGAIDPEQVVTPGVYVNTIFQGTYGPKRIEKRTNRPKSGARA